MTLISDSPYNEGDPIAAARQAAQKGILIHTVTFGDEANQFLMKAIANETGGRHSMQRIKVS